jgi:hypothetical protein
MNYDKSLKYASRRGRREQTRIVNYLSYSFPIENDLKYGDALSPLLFTFSLDYDIRKVQETRLGLDMNGTNQYWLILMM